MEGIGKPPNVDGDMGECGNSIHPDLDRQFISNLTGSRPQAAQRERIRAFLTAICQQPSIARATGIAQITSRTHYDWLRDVEGYPAAFEKAWKIGWDSFESACVERAQNGSRREVYQNGQLVGYQRVDCDNLALGMLKANIKKYQDAAPAAGGISIQLAIGLLPSQVTAAPAAVTPAVEVQALPPAEEPSGFDLSILPATK